MISRTKCLIINVENEERKIRDRVCSIENNMQADFE